MSILAAKPPDVPINFQDVPGLTTATQIGIKWDDGSYDGASPVLDYQLSYAEASSDVWTIWSTNLLEKTDIVTGLSAGTLYKLRVQSRNLINLSQHSAEIQILAAQTPDQPTSLVNVPNPATRANQIGLAWSEPTFDGGSAILSYQLWYDNATG